MWWPRTGKRGKVHRWRLKTLDGRGWLPKSVVGLDVLCLASGGGWQSILYASAGARVTVVDLSEGMLELDQQEAENSGEQRRLVQDLDSVIRATIIAS